MTRARTVTRGASMIGLLVTLVVIVVLSTVLMTSLNRTITGEGNTRAGTVRSFEDKLKLYALHQSMVVRARETRDRFTVPSVASGRDDEREDTTASLFSLMVMKGYVTPAQLISANERSVYVWKDDDYAYRLHDPAGGVYWDPDFRADLDVESNVSFAHLPLYGRRLDRHWAADVRSEIPLIGNRGPSDGVDDPESYTVGDDGRWAGHLLYGDGRIDFVETFLPAGLMRAGPDGSRVPDNIFAMEEGADGDDAILSFTKEMTADGPSLQHD